MIRKKALCSIGYGSYSALLEISAPTFAEYAARHGYDLVLRSFIGAEKRPAAWAKVPLILQLLEVYELVLWIDADAIIVDSSADLAAECRADRWIYLARNRTSDGLVPNTGVWMLRATAEAKQFLKLVNEHTAFHHHKWWENAAVIDLLGYDFDPVWPGSDNHFTDGVEYIARAWNSVPPDADQSPRIKHYAGLPLDVRRTSLLTDLRCLAEQSENVLRLSTATTRDETSYR